MKKETFLENKLDLNLEKDSELFFPVLRNYDNNDLY